MLPLFKVYISSSFVSASNMDVDEHDRTFKPSTEVSAISHLNAPHTHSFFVLQVPNQLVEERWTELHFTWASKSYKIEVPDSDRYI